MGRNPAPRPKGDPGPGFFKGFIEEGLGKEGNKKRAREDIRLDAVQVKQLHRASDKDAGSDAHHHSLGPGSTQAAPGNHSHRLIGIWLYRSTAFNHDTNGAYLNLPFDKYKFWDKEYYKKSTNAIIEVIKEHTALITYRCSFTGTAGGGGVGGNGRRGIRLITGIGNSGTFELNSLGGGATETRLHDINQAITLSAGEQVNVDVFQNCGGTLDVLAGLHVTNLKIVRSHPRRIDSQGLTAGGIVPQTPGPEIASRQLFSDGNW